MTTRAPLIVLRPVSLHLVFTLSSQVCTYTRTQEQKSIHDLVLDAVQSRTATVERISHFEKNSEEHAQRAQYYKEQAQELKLNLANMDAYLAEAWMLFEKSQHRGKGPKTSKERDRGCHAMKVSGLLYPVSYY